MTPRETLRLLATTLLLTLVAPLQAGLNKLLPDQLYDAQGKAIPRENLDGKIIGVYFSAEWCQPCRHFTPSLVKLRDGNQTDFEVVFVSSDRDARTQKKYMTSYKMQWPAVKHGSPEARKLKQRFKVRGIPTLVILDSDGNTLTINGQSAISRNPSGALAAWKKSSK